MSRSAGLAAPARAAFAPEEHRARAALLQERMAEAGLDTLLLTTAADLFYLTGFLTRFWESPTRPWFAILPASGAPIALVPSIGEALMRRSFAGRIETWPSPRPEDEGLSLLVATLSDLTPLGGRIGTPMGPETRLGLPLGAFEALRAGLAPRALVDEGGLMLRTRAAKSEAEIARIRTAAEAAGAGLAAIGALATPGQPLAALFREAQIAALGAGADWVAYLAGGAGQGGYEDVIAPASAARLAAGDVLMLDIGAVSGGYYCDFCRNWSVGPARDQSARAYAALLEAAEAGRAAARPGAVAADLHAAMAGRIAAAGFAPLAGRLGHGIGLTLTEPPSLTPDDATPLRAGMTLALEPGLALPSGRILVHEENVALGPEGAAALSPAPPRRLDATVADQAPAGETAP